MRAFGHLLYRLVPMPTRLNLLIDLDAGMVLWKKRTGGQLAPSFGAEYLAAVAAIGRAGANLPDDALVIRTAGSSGARAPVSDAV